MTASAWAGRETCQNTMMLMQMKAKRQRNIWESLYPAVGSHSKPSVLQGEREMGQERGSSALLELWLQRRELMSWTPCSA